MPTKIINLTNKTFGRLTVIKDSGKRDYGSVVWLCICSCGNKTEVRGESLRTGVTKSCGCLRKELTVSRFIKHGDGSTIIINKLYKIWNGIKNRCNNPNSKRYHRYGGRGIKVCNEWFNNYSAFKLWAISSGYCEGLTIDRIDNGGNYEPSNCQWLTRSENSKKHGR